ncbi:MAG: cysteine desulfurase [Clostridia bacterium]|nr:cysteine desulfurase [Clostridia bacterium]
MDRIYLDAAATTPLHPDVAATMAEVSVSAWGNPASVHERGRAARRVVDEARREVAALIGAAPQDVVFTSGGTESDNLAVVGAARARGEEGRNHVLCSAVEHHAVLEACRGLAREGFEVGFVPVDGEGVVDLDALRRMLRPDTALVALMFANNEVGALEPVAEAAVLAHAVGAWLHVDAVQGPGWLPIDVGALGADLLALSAHKFYGPKGVGALWVRPGVRVRPLLRGGGQERAWRPGTVNVPAIAGFGRAARIARSYAAGPGPEAVRRLRDRLAEGLLASIPGVRLSGPQGAGRLPDFVHVTVAGVSGEALVLALDLAGVDASSGAACTSGSLEPSHVLRAMGLPPELAASGLRLTLLREATGDEVDEAVRRIRDAVARLRRGAARRVAARA